MTPLIQSVVRSFANAEQDPTEFHWFHFTGQNTKPSPQFLLDDARLPFEKCMICGESDIPNGYGRIQSCILVTGSNIKDGIAVSVWFLFNYGKPKPAPSFIFRVHNGDKQYLAGGSHEPVNKTGAFMIINNICDWLASMSCRVEAYVPTEKSAVVNRRRTKHGKAPIYEWRTVVIEPSQPRQEPQGGTHASPRLHDRRGHLRRLRSGKNVWVRPCKVGDASRGIVFHDYKLGDV